MEQQRQQLHQRLGLDQHLLQCVVHLLPVHPRHWNMVAVTCSELRAAVNSGREALRCDVRFAAGTSRRWRDQWAGRLLVKLAAYEETAEAIRVVVAGAPVDYRYRSEENDTALIWAARHGDVELVDALIGVGAQLDLQDDGSSTALMWAAYRGYTEIAVALINAAHQ